MIKFPQRHPLRYDKEESDAVVAIQALIGRPNEDPVQLPTVLRALCQAQRVQKTKGESNY